MNVTHPRAEKIELIYFLPEGITRKFVEEELSAQCVYIAETAQDASFGLYDTFDWRLFQEGLALHLAGTQLSLIDYHSGEVLHNLAVNHPPQFAWDLPGGELRRILEPILEMRALLDLVEVKKGSITYRVLNRDEKTVARLVYEDFKIRGGRGHVAAGAYVHLKAVRGYPRYLRALGDFCRAAGFVSSSPGEMHSRLIEAAGRTPGDYSAKLNFQLAPEMRSDDATKVILKFLLETMRRNEQGIQEDIDTEFLHDFRVAVRRTRSALTQMKGVFPAEISERYKKGFSSIGNFTNRLRDLDVYLLNEVSYRAMLPQAMQEKIMPLFTYLRGRRSEALEEALEGLDSEDYARTLREWDAFLNSHPLDAPDAPNAARPIFDLASQRIYKQYRSIIKGGERILENTEDDLLHALRIECKKLRSLMEFFSSLFPRKMIATLIKQLKILQDNLGEFNDLTVQEEYLMDIAGELPVRNNAERQTLMAIGSLVEALDERKKVVKGDFAETFTHFASSKNRRLFRELFKESRKVESGARS